jgi:hypothetical protein
MSTSRPNLLLLDTWFAHAASSFQTGLAVCLKCFVLVVLKRFIHIMQVRASRGRIQFRRKLPKPSMHAAFLLPLSRGISRWKRCMTSLRGMRRCSLCSIQILTVSHCQLNVSGSNLRHCASGVLQDMVSSAVRKCGCFQRF